MSGDTKCCSRCAPIEPTVAIKCKDEHHDHDHHDHDHDHHHHGEIYKKT